MKAPPLPNPQSESSMTEERKYAILFAATLLCARKLNELDSDRPSPAKVAQSRTRLVRLPSSWSTSRGDGRKNDRVRRKHEAATPTYLRGPDTNCTGRVRISPRFTVPHVNHSAVSSFFDQCTGGELLLNLVAGVNAISQTAYHSGMHRQEVSGVA